MPTCKDCVHYEPCRDTYYNNEEQTRIPFGFLEKDGVDKDCAFFKDRSKFIELPDLGEYTTVTTLDEAIDHCFSIVNSTDDHICAECKAEHMRLCGWLGELKSRVEAEQALKEREKELEGRQNE